MRASTIASPVNTRLIYLTAIVFLLLHSAPRSLAATDALFVERYAEVIHLIATITNAGQNHILEYRADASADIYYRYIGQYRGVYRYGVSASNVTVKMSMSMGTNIYSVTYSSSEGEHGSINDIMTMDNSGILSDIQGLLDSGTITYGLNGEVISTSGSKAFGSYWSHWHRSMPIITHHHITSIENKESRRFKNTQTRNMEHMRSVYELVSFERQPAIQYEGEDVQKYNISSTIVIPPDIRRMAEYEALSYEGTGHTLIGTNGHSPSSQMKFVNRTSSRGSRADQIIDMTTTRSTSFRNLRYPTITMD